MRPLLVLLLVACSGCTTITITREFTRPRARRWLDGHRDQAVEVEVRPESDPGTVDGTLIGRDDDGIEIRTRDRIAPIDAADILRVRHRDPGAGALDGAKVGAGAGFFPALLVGVIACAAGGSSRDVPGRFAMGFFATLAIPMALGSMIGLAVGHVDELQIEQAPP